VVVDSAKCPVLSAQSLVVVADQVLPQVADGDVLIEVAYAGVNAPDLMQRQGKYPAPKGHSSILGLEVSGVVVAVGSKTSRVQVGDTVCALTPGGGYAQYCTAPEGSCLPLPAGLSLREAAAVPETFFTVWRNVFMTAGLKADETLLVHGGAGGIGSTAIQLAKAVGASVITTAGSDEKCAFCRELGADLAINYQTQDFVAEVKAKLGKGRGVDVLLDMVGGDYFQRNLQIMGTGGRHVSIAFRKGSSVTVDLLPLLLRRLTLSGSTLRHQSAAYKMEIADQLKEHVWPMLASGAVKPRVDREYALEEAGRAHADLEQGRVKGKVVLAVPRVA